MSVKVFAAVNISFWVAVPLMVTLPAGRSLTLTTAVVGALVTLSGVPCPST